MISNNIHRLKKGIALTMPFFYYIVYSVGNKFYRKTLNFLPEKFAKQKIISTFVIE